jgi:hypothetical protein
VAELLGIDVHIIQHAAFSGELRAQIAGHGHHQSPAGRCPDLAGGGRRIGSGRPDGGA